MPHQLGDRIRQARKRYGMSQVELAKRAHISRQQLYMLETNQTPDPGVLKVLAIARVLGVSVDTLLAGTEVPPPPRWARRPAWTPQTSIA